MVEGHEVFHPVVVLGSNQIQQEGGSFGAGTRKRDNVVCLLGFAID